MKVIVLYQLVEKLMLPSKSFVYTVAICIATMFMGVRCTTESVPMLIMTIENNIEKNAILMAFAGDKQIFVDSISFESGRASYPISQKCNSGVYRLQYGQSMIDFLYDGNSLELVFDATNIYPSLQEKADTLNKLFLHFHSELAELSSLQTDEKFCERYHELFNSYLTNKAVQNTLLQDIVELLYLPDYNCYTKLTGDVSFDEKGYMTEKYISYITLSEGLASTPYLYPVLDNYFSYYSAMNDSVFLLATNNLLQYVTSSEQYTILVKGIVDKKIHQQKRVGALSKRYSDQCKRNLDTAFFNEAYMSSGEFVDYRPNIDASKIALVVFMDECSLAGGVQDSLEQIENAFESEGVKLLIDSSASEVILNKLNIHCFPSALVLNSFGTVISRWNGTAELSELYSSYKENKNLQIN